MHCKWKAQKVFYARVNVQKPFRLKKMNVIGFLFKALIRPILVYRTLKLCDFQKPFSYSVEIFQDLK